MIQSTRICKDDEYLLSCLLIKWQLLYVSGYHVGCQLLQLYVTGPTSFFFLVGISSLGNLASCHHTTSSNTPKSSFLACALNNFFSYL